LLSVGEKHLKDEFINIYDEFFDDVYRYVYVKTSNKWDTEDIVSETFRKAFEKWDVLNDKTGAKSWLLAIARNTVIDYYRRKKHLPMGDDVEFYLQSQPFEDPFEQSADLDCLKQSLRHLSKEEYEITNLRYFAGLKFKEMAAILQKAEDSLRVKANRLTKKLGKLVKKCLGEI